MWYSMRPCYVMIAPRCSVVNIRGRWGRSRRRAGGGGMACAPIRRVLWRRRGERGEKGETVEEGQGRAAGHAVAILDATVRSLSSFALFRSNACCRQLSS